MRTLLAKRPYFQATVAWWGPDSWHDEAVTSRAIANEWPTFEQLFAASDDCRVFGEERVANVFGTMHRRATDHTEWPAWAKPAGGRKLGLEVRSDAGAKREFMSVALVRGVALCFVLDPERVAEELLLPRLADPFQLTSRFGIAPDTAKPQIRAIVRRSALVALMTRNAYGLDVEFHGDSALIGNLFDRTLTVGRWTKGFEQGNCRYDVRPFEVGGTLLWEAVSRKRHGLDVAIRQLEAAEEDPNGAERVTQDALAAAELLAAFAGRPPQVYTEVEPDRNRRIIAWMEEKRGQFSVKREDLALARRALEAIVERSAFPDRQWRTLPPKAKWERATLELIGRIVAAEEQAP